MELKIYWIFLLVVFSIIDLSFSAVFFPFQDRNPEEDYINSKSESVYRGLFLSYTLPEKILICRDLFSAYLEDEKTTVISDGLANEGVPQHILSVERIKYFVDNSNHDEFEREGERRHTLQNAIEALFFKCSGVNLVPRYTDKAEYFVSSTFQHGLMYTGSEVNVLEEQREIILKSYMGRSPEFVSLDQAKLEEQYVTSRLPIRGLRTESLNYVQMIEGRDSISQLSVWQKYLLCSSIILSPKYEADRRKFILRWPKYREAATKNNIHLYRRKCLTFENAEHQIDNWCTDCLYCNSSVENIDDPKSKNLILTRAYDDQHSLYVLIDRLIDGKKAIFLQNYAKNVPILINSRVRFTDDPKYIDPDYEE